MNPTFGDDHHQLCGATAAQCIPDGIGNAGKAGPALNVGRQPGCSRAWHSSVSHGDGLLEHCSGGGPLSLCILHGVANITGFALPRSSRADLLPSPHIDSCRRVFKSRCRLCSYGQHSRLLATSNHGVLNESSLARHGVHADTDCIKQFSRYMMPPFCDTTEYWRMHQYRTLKLSWHGMAAAAVRYCRHEAGLCLIGGGRLQCICPHMHPFGLCKGAAL